MNTNQYLAEEKISKLILKFSIPCITSMLVSSLYNIVDQIFVGRGIGYLGNGATNVVFPITVITLALALLIGDGCRAYLSIALGKNNEKTAAQTVGNAITVTVITAIAATVLFLVFKDKILIAFGATENNIRYAEEYFGVIVLGIPFYMFTSALNSVIRADGSPAFAMASTIIGCVINLILDPLAIFVFKMGMTGAALATITGQIVTAVLSGIYITRMKSVKLIQKSFRPDFKIIKSFLPLGISSFLTQISIVVAMGVMNNTLVKYGASSPYGADIPLTVMGIVMKVFQIVISIAIGIAAGCQPIVGYNFGAGRTDRVREIYKAMMKAEITLGVISLLMFQIFPRQILGLFGTGEPEYFTFGVRFFRIFLFFIWLDALQPITSTFFTSIGKPAKGIFLSLTRQIIFFIPLLLILPRFMGIEGCIYCGPIADFLSAVVTIIMAFLEFKNMPKQDKNR